MAIVSDIEIRLRADIARLQQDMNAMRRTVDNGMSGVSRSVEMAKKALASLGGAMLLKELVSQVITAQREFDKLNASLVTATGSTAGAAQAFGALQRFAATTPYSVAEATEAFIKLRNLGLNPGEAALRSYGNTAASMSKSLNQMIEAVADAATGQFERLKEFGITANQQGDRVSLTFQGVTKTIGKNSKEIQEYLRAIGDVNFAGAMERQANSLDGAISNLGDTWASVLRSISSNGFGEGIMSGVLALSGALTDLSAIIDAVGGAASEQGKAVKELSGLHKFLTTVFEAVAVAGVNVAYVFKTIGKDIGAFMAQAAALFNGGFKGLVNGSTLSEVQKIGRERVAEAEAERKAVDAKSAAIINASKNAEVARAKAAKNTQDELSGYEIVLTAEQKKQKADQDSIEIRNKLNGVNAQTAGDLAKLKTALETGVISQKEYNKYTAQIHKDTVLASTAYKDGAKAIELSTEAIKRREQAQIAANKADQEQLDFLHRTGQLSDEDFITKQSDATIKALNDQKAAMEAQRALLAKRYDTESARASLTTQIEAKEQDIAAAKIKREHDIFELEQKNYRTAIEQTANLIEAAQEKARAEEQNTQQMQDEVDALGLTGQALADLTAARLRDRAAALDRQAEISLIDEVTEALRRQADELRAQADLGLTKFRVTEQQKFWGDIEETAHDVFKSIEDTNKSLWQRMKDSAKTLFFDWLYSMTLKKWIINIGTEISGASAVAGIVSGGGSTGSGGLLSTLGNASSLYNSATSLAAGNLGSGFLGSLVGGMNGAGIGSGLTSAAGMQIGSQIASVVGPQVASTIASGLGAVATAVPYVAIASAIYAVGEKAFGMGPKEYNGTSTIEGTIGPDGLNAAQYAEWKKKGGWFRSDKHGRDRFDLNADTASGLADTYKAIQVASSEYAKVLGINADSIMNRTQAIKIALGKDEAANQKAITDFFTGVGNTIAAELLPNIAQFSKEGEAASTTLQRIATNFKGIDMVMETLGRTFGAVGVESIAARERLVDLSGGLEAFGNQAAFFVQNFYTEADKAKMLQKPVQDQLDALGLSAIKTTAQFKDAVLALDLTTEQGAKQYAGLMAIAPQFKIVADFMAQAQATAEEAAKAAAEAALDAQAELLEAQNDLDAQYAELAGQKSAILQRQREKELAAMDESLRPIYERIYALQDEKAALDALNEKRAANREYLNGLMDQALAAVGRAVNAQKDAVNKAFDASMKAFDASIAQVNETISRTSALSQAIKGASVSSIKGDDSNGAMSQAGRAQIQAALAIAKASGVLPNLDDIKDALAAVGTDSADNYESFADYNRAVAQTNAALDSLGGLTDNQLDTAQQQLKVLNDAKDAAQAQHDAEIERLDSIMAAAQAEVDAVNGVNTSVMSVASAVAGLQTIIGAIKSAPAAGVGGGVGSYPKTLEDLYQQVLGRAPDAAGYDFWKKAFGDTIDENEYLDFVKGAKPELEGLVKPPPAVSTPQSGTMSKESAMVGELQTLNERMRTVESGIRSTADATSQLAQQFHQVSGGGNALATEVI